MRGSFIKESTSVRMKKDYFPVFVVFIILALLVGGYFGYQYIKFNPPGFLIDLLTSQPPPPPLPEGEQAPLVVPEGFAATIFARDIAGARVMVRDNNGVMLASLTGEGKVVALPDEDKNGEADKTVTILSGLDRPHGILVRCTTGSSCTLYVAETGKLDAYAYDAASFKATFEKTIARFPTDGGHYTRTLLMHKDGRLLVSVGSSCNVCNEETPVRASVQAVDVATGKMQTFASGLRNTVFMATHPTTGAIWGTDNGRDILGDDIPPDEVNIIEEGKNYGWPLCFGKNIHDTDFDKKQYVRDPCTDAAPSFIDIPAHSAALGLAFVPREGWPEEWRNDLLVAYHGSWNRSEPAGYKVVRFDFTNGVLNDQFSADFVTGFLPEGADEGEAIGRPVGVFAEPNGVVYVSDDRAGAIYRITLLPQ
jgi:glucose/arabinose dehydrogenase